MVEICTVGGYNEVGKNMVAVKTGDDVVLLDMGFHMQRIVDFEEEGGSKGALSVQQMIGMDAVPDDRVLASWKRQVKMIALSHAHLDHIGAVPYLASRYQAPVHGTPFTIAVLDRMMKNDALAIPNPLHPTHTGKEIPISKDVSVEFVHITHSTPQSSFIAVHTKKGVLLYGTDFKLDNHPVIGKMPDVERLKELRDEGVLALFVDSLYSKHNMKTPSEKVAREMLKDVLFGTENEGRAIVGTCFASHLARLKSFTEFGRKMGRKVVFLGRTMMKYTDAAADVGVIDLRKDVEVVGFGRDVKRKLKDIEKKGPENYLIVCSGGQGEPNAVLRRMMKQDYPFRFMNDDHVIFSNRVIPVEPNVTNRQEIERRLKEFGVRIFSDIHVSGHGGKEDIRDLITMTDPAHIIPCHGPRQLVEGTGDLAQEMGYKIGSDVHYMKNGHTLRLG